MSMKTHVLLVDDSRGLRQMMKRYLGSVFEFDLSEAADGEEALRMIQEFSIEERQVDIIVLDWMMPKMSGFELLQRLRGIDLFKKFPRIVMVTAETYADQVEACMNYDISAYVTKPFSQEQVVAAVQKVLETGELKNAV